MPHPGVVLLKEIRERQGRSQADVARELGIDQTSISKYEQGLRDVDIETFCRWATALGNLPGDLLENAAGVYPEIGKLVAQVRDLPAAMRSAILDPISAILAEHARVICELRKASSMALRKDAARLSEDFVKAVRRVSDPNLSPEERSSLAAKIERFYRDQESVVDPTQTIEGATKSTES